MIDAIGMIRQNYSYQDAINAYATGWTSRKELRRFYRLWAWSAVRFEGEPNLLQERYSTQFGLDHTYKRIERTAEFVERLKR